MANPTARVTAPKIRGMKMKGEKIVCLTAYDALTGALADASGVDVILVGDSLGNTVLGFENTLPVTLEMMIHHTSATRRGVNRALLVADMPYGSYGSSVAQAVDSAVALVRAGAEAVKLEGTYTEEIQAIIKTGIPVMGHVGMTPQSINNFGGHKVQGKNREGTSVLAAAKAIDDAGTFSMVLELIPADLSKMITEQVECPTIGIGGGPNCDGQIQVLHDVLGLSPLKLRHARAFCQGRDIFSSAIQEYAAEVRAAAFPTSEHSS